MESEYRIKNFGFDFYRTEINYSLCIKRLSQPEKDMGNTIFSREPCELSPLM